MAVADRYSRAVAWLKVLLPLLALAILSTLFLVARTLDPSKAIPYAKVDVDRILREQGVTRPTFGGVTSDGTAIAFSASEVRPESAGSSRFRASDLNARLTFPDQGMLDVAGPEGVIDGGAGELMLKGGVQIDSSTGYHVNADQVLANLKQTQVTTDGSVTATGPAGQITAGNMELTRSTAAGQSYLLVFKGGVRLIYDPNR